MIGRPPVPEAPLLLLDYDGTLAPIVADPAQARPHGAAVDLIRRLQTHLPVFVVSGRDLATLGRLLVDDDGPLRVPAIGLHGAEEGIVGEPAERDTASAVEPSLRSMRRTVPLLAGVEVEPKGHAAFAVHYRRAADTDAARSNLERWAATAPQGLEVLWGKMVVELRPAGVSKGRAVTRLAGRHPDHVPVYLGDDATDEEAFDALNTDVRAVTVKVGEEATSARYRLRSVDEVIDYLSLIAHRTGHAAPR